MRNARLGLIALLALTSLPQAAWAQGQGQDPGQRQAQQADGGSFWQRLWKIVRGIVRREDTQQVPLRSKGTPSVSLLGISPDTLAYVLQSNGTLVIPWRTSVDATITVSRGDAVLADARGQIGMNHLAVPGALSSTGLLKVTIDRYNDDGSPLPTVFRILVIPPTQAPALPSDQQGATPLEQRLGLATYWAVNKDFCYFEKPGEPNCGAWRLAAYQLGLEIRQDSPEIGQYFIEQLEEQR